jgi:hypothetical protein
MYHPRESKDPAVPAMLRSYWIPAFAGMTPELASTVPVPSPNPALNTSLIRANDVDHTHLQRVDQHDLILDHRVFQVPNLRGL